MVAAGAGLAVLLGFLALGFIWPGRLDKHDMFPVYMFGGMGLLAALLTVAIVASAPSS